MNYDQARQRQAGSVGAGRWDWTTANRRLGVRPDGYCAGWHDWTEESAALVGRPLSELQAEQEQREGPHRAKYHVDGHATQEEAERCFYFYSLDHLFAGEWEPGASCEHPGCSTFSKWGLDSRAYGHLRLTMLCDAHRNRDGMAAVHPFKPGIRHIHS